MRDGSQHDQEPHTRSRQPHSAARQTRRGRRHGRPGPRTPAGGSRCAVGVLPPARVRGFSRAFSSANREAVQHADLRRIQPDLKSVGLRRPNWQPPRPRVRLPPRAASRRCGSRRARRSQRGAALSCACAALRAPVHLRAARPRPPPRLCSHDPVRVRRAAFDGVHRIASSQTRC